MKEPSLLAKAIVAQLKLIRLDRINLDTEIDQKLFHSIIDGEYKRVCGPKRTTLGEVVKMKRAGNPEAE